jgi:ribosomal protein S18 acetylase RimI-like enzyme
MLTPDMKLALRTVTRLDEALALAPLLDASAAEFHAQCSDDPYPEGASERFLRAHLAHPASVLIVAEEQGAPPASRAWGVCVTGPFTDPLLGTLQPMVLVLHVDPALRHRGVARELVDQADSLLRSRGYPTLAARAGHNDDALISMGERWGFVRSWELMVRE